MARITTAVRILLTVLSVPLGAMLILAGILLAMSPGKPKPFLDANGNRLAGSISEKIRVDINGVQQGMFIMGKDAGNPVLLFLHGGTAMPEYFLKQSYAIDLEEYFTVCWWDRRGAELRAGRLRLRARNLDLLVPVKHKGGNVGEGYILD